jgi:hypothetical protein
MIYGSEYAAYVWLIQTIRDQHRKDEANIRTCNICPIHARYGQYEQDESDTIDSAD